MFKRPLWTYEWQPSNWLGLATVLSFFLFILWLSTFLVPSGDLIAEKTHTGKVTAFFNAGRGAVYDRGKSMEVQLEDGRLLLFGAGEPGSRKIGDRVVVYERTYEKGPRDYAIAPPNI